MEKKAMGAFCLKKGAAPAPDHEDVPLNSLLRLASGTMVCTLLRLTLIRHVYDCLHDHENGTLNSLLRLATME